MKPKALFFLFFVFPLFSHFEYDPHLLHDGKVNLITGELQLQQIDYVVEGIQPIPLTRFFEKKWLFLPQTYFHFVPEKDKWGQYSYQTIEIGEPNGSILTYKKEENQITLVLPKGAVNTARGEMGGNTNLKNQWLEEVDEVTYLLHCADGTTRFYTYGYEGKEHELVYLLRYEHLPNQNYFFYEYDQENRLSSITSTASDGKTPFAYAHFHYLDTNKGDNDFDILTSDGKTFSYRFGIVERSKKKGNSLFLLETNDTVYEYVKLSKGLGFRLADDTITYDEEGRVQTCKDAIISYFPNKTEVTTPSGKTVYHFNSNHQLVHIEGMNPLLWSWNGQGELLQAGKHHYLYDSRGNVIEENGTKKTFDENNRLIQMVDPEGVVTRLAYNDRGQKIQEIFELEKGDRITTFTYDEQGRLKTKSCGELRTEYTYGPEQWILEKDLEGNLLTKLPIRDKEKPLAPQEDREGVHKEYNEKGNLIELYTEDGTVHYTLEYNKRGEPIHLIDHVKKKEGFRTYDREGNLIQETLLNGETLKSEYDLYGRRTTLQLPDESKIHFDWGPKFLKEVRRSPGNDEFEYQHRFLEYNLFGFPTQQRLIQGLGELNFETDEKGEILSVSSRHFKQKKGEEEEFSFTSPSKPYSVIKDGLGRIVSFITSDKTIHYTYDIWNRRMTKEVEDAVFHFIYDDEKEIGLLSPDLDGYWLSQLKVVAEHPVNTSDHAVVYEIRGIPYIPLHDLQGNVRHLFSVVRQKIIESYQFTPNGYERIYDYWNQPLHYSKAKNPWRFHSYPIDEETGVLFVDGKYYDPSITTGGFLENWEELSPNISE